MALFVKISISNQTIQAIRHGDGNKEELLIADMDHAHDNIHSLVRNYETEREHKGQAITFHPIKTVTINQVGSGSFTLYFPVNIFNGCKGIDANFDDKVHITIKLDMENNTALLIGEERMPEREPDDC